MPSLPVFDLATRRGPVQAVPQESGDTYKTFLDLAPDIIYSWDKDGNWSYINSAGLEALEAPPEQVLGTPWFRWVSRECWQTTLDIFNRSFGQGSDAFAYQSALVSAGGKSTDLAHNVRVLRDEHHEILGALGFARKMTGTGTVEGEPARDSKLLSAVLEVCEAPIIVLDQDGNVVRFNRASQELTGCTPAEVSGKPLWETILPQEEMAAAKTALETVRGGESLHRADFSILSKKGSRRLISWNLKLVDEGQAAGRFVVMSGVDIQEQRHVEVALERAAREWRATFDSIGDPVCLLDSEGRVVRCNTAMQNLLGVPFDQIIGRPCRDLLQEATDGATSYPAMQVQESLHREVGELAFGDRLFTVMVDPVLDGEGRLTGSVHLMTDITERRRLDEELKRSHEKVQRVLEGTIQAMAVSVEIRDPYAAGHRRRVAKLACDIGNKMDLPQSQIDGLHLAGLVHDIGKVVIPLEILSKPGNLSSVEQSIVARHSNVGFDILKSIEFPRPVAQIVAQHHERIDGSGYPQGLTGTDILLEARILGVADVVDAMTSHRPHRQALSIDEVMAELQAKRGIAYDAGVVDACMAFFEDEA